MILRRVIDHVKAQNWTAVALDFVIVVLGVFIGIQVSNWNAARGERAKEYGYLVRLHEDMQRSIATIDRTIGMLERQSAGQTILLDALAECAVPPGAGDKLEYAISTLGYINAPIFSSRTYDELTSSGSFDIIENEQIKTSLSDVVRRVTHLSQSVENVYRITEHHRFTVEENVLFSEITPYDEFGSTASVDFDISELCENKKIASAVSAIRLQTFDRLQAYQALAALYRKLPPLIEKEIEARWGRAIDASSAAGLEIAE
ncbi:MAG: hypothetical protein AB7F91_06150 [Parvularculaceae bacterium]